MEPVIRDTGASYYAVTVSKSRTADYLIKKAKSEFIPPLPYSLKVTSIKRQGVKTKVIQRSTGAWANTYTNTEPSDYGSFTNPFATFVRECDGMLGNKVLNKLKGQSAPVLMLYRERKETESMILSFLSQTRKAVKVLRHPTTVFSIYRGYPPRTVRDKRFISRMRRILKRTHPSASAGDVWLQYRYAWSTAWMDVCDAFNALTTSRKKFSSTFVKATLPSRSWSGITDKPCGSYSTLLGEASGTYGAHMKVFYEISDSLMAAASQLQDPVSFLYDAIPYSFVLDWMVNISGYLDLQTATTGLVFKGGYTSKLSHFIFTWKPGKGYDAYSSSSAYRYECLDKSVNVSYSTMSTNRTIMTSFPTPTLEFPVKLTVNRINDAVALIRGRMKRSF